MKLEKYRSAFDIYFRLLNQPETEEYKIKEELIVNILNTVIHLLFSQSKALSDQSELRVKIENILKEIFRQGFEHLEMRESFINYLLFLIVLDKTKVIDVFQILGEEFDLIETGKHLVGRIESSIKEEEEGMEVEGEDELNFLNFKGDKFEDYLTLFILRTFFMKKSQSINWKDTDVAKIQRLVFHNAGDLKPNLRISLLSYLVLIHTLSSQSPILEQLDGQLSQELVLLKNKENASVYLRQQLYFNKCVVLLHLQNYKDAGKILTKNLDGFQDFRLHLLPLELSVLVGSKNKKKFGEQVQVFRQQIKKVREEKRRQKLQCLFYLFQISFFHSQNNQKDYIKTFIRFLDEFFMEEIKKQDRFVNDRVFTQFAQNVVFYILRNQNILNFLREKIVALVQFISDPKAVAKIAEQFLIKKEFEVALQLYEYLVKNNPGNILFLSRLNYIFSVTEPEKIQVDQIPEFDLKTDFNTLSNLENEYLKFLNQDPQAQQRTREYRQNPTGQEEKTRKKIRKKKYRIKWPKNFDFENPGPRPDKERWIPKMQRKKYRKRALKKGILTRTQGGNADNSKTEELFT